MPADKSEIHKFLVEDLSNQRKTLIDFAFRNGGFAALLLGWIVSSKEAQAFVRDNPVARFGLPAIIIIYAFLYAGWVLGMLRLSRDTRTKLDRNGHMQPDLYSHVTITPGLAWSYICLHVVLCCGMTAFILFSK